jgi:NitT/TauT family transport system permease protein
VVCVRENLLHLGITLLETVLAFAWALCSGLRSDCGSRCHRSPPLLDPYIKAANSMPRVILAPIFAVWFGLGMLVESGSWRDARIFSSCSSTSTRA